MRRRSWPTKPFLSGKGWAKPSGGRSHAPTRTGYTPDLGAPNGKFFAGRGLNLEAAENSNHDNQKIDPHHGQFLFEKVRDDGAEKHATRTGRAAFQLDDARTENLPRKIVDGRMPSESSTTACGRQPIDPIWLFRVLWKSVDCGKVGGAQGRN